MFGFINGERQIMKKTVVLGGSGVIGHELVKQLSFFSTQIVATFNQTLPTQIPFTYPSNVSWIPFPKLEEEWMSMLNDAHTVIHLANKVWNGPRLTKDPNGPINEENPKNDVILSQVIKHNVQKFIWVSSSIGYVPGGPCTENNFFNGEVTGRYKSLSDSVREFEKVLKSAPSRSNIDIRVFRPTTIFGRPTIKPANDSHAIIKMLDDLVSVKKTRVFVPEVPRNYIYARDFATLLQREWCIEPEKGICEAYNTRGDGNLTLSEIALTAVKILGLSSSSLEFIQSEAIPTLIDLPTNKIKSRISHQQSALPTIILEIIQRLQEIAKRDKHE